MTYKFKQSFLRIRWVDLQRLRHVFKAERKESAASYFQRLAMWLKQGKAIRMRDNDRNMYQLDDVKVSQEEWEKWWSEAQLE